MEVYLILTKFSAYITCNNFFTVKWHCCTDYMKLYKRGQEIVDCVLRGKHL